MTLFEPTLRVNRLVVLQGGHRALDCEFHAGVNVVRGRNSSGKTTTMDLLAFSLGAENIRWKPEALLCTQTIVEVILNEGVACLRREISSEGQRPMAIYWGDFEAAIDAGPERWELYPFKRTALRTSFTQAIFNALRMPQAQGDGASNLTMHQLLRVLYADQPSVHSPIFRIDTFDSPLTREMVGGYLAGVYDDELYSAQLRCREINAQLGKHISELRGIFNVLGQSGQSPDLNYSNDRIVALEKSRAELTETMLGLKEKRSLPRAEVKKAGVSADGLRTQLNAARRNESELKDELSELELEIGDSQLFVREIADRLQNLEESKATRSYFGDMPFRFCPSCLNPLSEERVEEHHCVLCTSPLRDENSNSQLLRMRNELNVQLRESQSLIDSRLARIETLRSEIPTHTARIKQLAREYASIASTWASDEEIAIEETARKLGVLDEEIRQAHERQRLASIIAGLQKQRDELTSELARLEELIEALEKKQESRKVEVSKVIEESMIRLLKLDLPLQPEFVAPHSVAIDFVDNAVYVNGSRNFSESSAVVLRHIFHLALLTASTIKEYMRVPRFMMLDGIDDGGMEKERSHRLQEIIVDECATYQTEYQLIYATSEINPKIKDSDLVVGRFFTPEQRSLDVRRI